MRIFYSVYAKGLCIAILLRQIKYKRLPVLAAFLVLGNLNAQIVIQGNANVDCSCPAGADGFLDISVSGGTPPYTYEWTLNGSEVICSPRVDFSGLNNIGCPSSGQGQECSPDQSCSDPSDAINAQNFVIGDAILTVSPPIANGGACVDENLINDSTLDGFFAIRTGVSQLGNAGPAANVTRTWTFSNPVCDLQILLNDIDGEDAIIVNGKLNGATIPLDSDDFILTNTTPESACPVFVGANTWESQGGCPAQDNTNRGGILITFPSCLDEIEFIYYDYTGDVSAGGSYAVGFSNICAADLQCLEGGMYQVEVTDATGLTGIAQFVVEAPSGPVNIVCPEDIVTNTDQGACNAIVNWVPPTLEDGCPAQALICTSNPGDVFPIGTTTVSCTGTDDFGNTSTCQFDITVNYGFRPTLVCPIDIIVNADQGSCVAPGVTWVPPSLSDGCELTTLTSNFQPGDDFPTGTSAVVYVGTDSGGNTFECSFDVTVINTGVPLILNCPNDINLTTTPGQCDAVATWTPPTIDPTCNGVFTSVSHQPGDTFPIGTTIVTYVVTDDNGNSNECSFNITVDYDADPTLVCPPNIAVDADAGSCMATSVTWEPPTLDNDCDLISLTSNFQPGDDFPTGTTTVTYAGTDPGGNIFICSFNITVTNTDVPIILNCPNDITLNAAPGTCEAAVIWTPPMPDPNCNAIISSSSHEPGDLFPAGTTTVTYIIIDGSGNTNECSFDITVNFSVNPTLDCPADISVNAEVGECFASATWIPPTLSNDCELTTLTSNFDPGDNFPAGTTTVSYTGTTEGGLVFECSFEVTVINDEQTIVLECPADISLVTAPGECDAAATWIPPVPNAECGAVLTGSNFEPGDVFPIGTTTVIYTAEDQTGNMFECSFEVTVIYDVTPTLLCPANITVNADAGSCTAAVSWVPPTLSNDCFLTTLDSDFDPGDNFPTGTTTVTYTGTDGAGNVFMCSFDITVINTGLPLILDCPNDINMSTDPGQCDAIVTWIPPTADPNCDAVITSSTNNPGDAFPIGTTTVTYVVTDNNGNTNECSFDITITYDVNPTLVCPNNITVNADAGSCTATAVNWIPPTLSNDCELTMLTSNFNPGDDFPTGTTTVSYIGSDSGGNTFQCSFQITVINTGVPLILNCPSDIALNTAAGECVAAVSWVPPIPDPACDAIITDSTHEPGDIFPIGTTTVTYVVTDGSGNTNECSFEVTINYDVMPTLVCPADIAVNADIGSCLATAVNWIPPSLSNDCELTTLTSNFQPGDDFPTGTSTVTYVGSDTGGNIFECSFDVVVTNTDVPLILNCPSDITFAAGGCDAEVTWTPPTPDPNCDAVITSASHEPGDDFPVGTTTVTYVVTDGSGNTSLCSFDVTITFDVTPTLVCPDDIIVNADPGSCTATAVNWVTPSLSNGCTLAELNGNFNPGDSFPTGTTTVSYIGMDSNENIFECAFDITVINTGVPLIINCPSDITLTLGAGECETTVDWIPPMPDPNCNAVITSASHEPGGIFPPGTTTVTYIITDGSGNTNECSFDITVNFNVNPTLECPDDISVNAPLGDCVTSVTWLPPSLSNGCDLPDLTSNFSPGDNFPAGTTTVTYTGMTGGGLVFECSFDVTVVNDAQTTVLECPSDLNLLTIAGQCEAIGTWTPPVPDADCGAVITGSTHEPGDVFSIGTTTVTYTAEDQTGNIFECSFDITVTYDSTPTLVCPDDISVTADVGSCTATTVTWLPPTLSNDCELTTLTSDFEPGDDFPTGTTTVTYTGTDTGGNIFECTFDVTVINNGPPIIVNCPNEITIATMPGGCDAAVTWLPPTVDENCDAIITDSTHEPGDIFPIGTTTVTYTATDANGQEATCSFDITVVYDQTPLLFCPQSIALNASPGACVAALTWVPPTLSNNCELLTLTSTHEPGDLFPVGITTVVYTATDLAGNIFECDFNITINSNGPPLILDCPDDIDVQVGAGQCDGIATWTPPTPDPNCNAVITSSSHEPGDMFPIGTTTVTYVITDISGEESTCTFDVNVMYDLTPTLVCPSNVTVNAALEACTASATWLPPTLSNGCQLTMLTSDFESGDAFPIGTTTVTYTGTDSGGNTFGCTFDVTVIGGDQSGSLICPNDITVGLIPGQCESSVTWTPPMPNPDCGITVVGSDFEPGDLFPIGTTTVTYTAIDDNGNALECSFDITVTYGNNAPVLICPQNIVVGALPGTCSSPVTWAPPIFSSLCGLATLEGDFEPGDNFSIGTTTVTYIGLDVGGNVFECSFEVTVTGGGNPVFLNCPADISLVAAPGECDAPATWIPPTVDENCGFVITSSSHEPSDIFPAGTTTVTYIATDPSGNQLECIFDVNIAYDIVPVLVCPNNITVDAVSGACTAVANWEIPTLSNDCELSIVTGNFEPGDALPIGTTTVTYIASDFGGNEFECSFEVTVNGDVGASSLVCPDDITQSVTPGQCATSVTWTPPMPDPNCGIIVTGSTHQPGDIFQIGTTTVTYTAIDSNGNTFECTFDITITYSEQPTLNCPSDITVNAIQGTCSAPVTWAPPLFSSTCGLASLEGNFEPGDVFPLGTTTVMYIGIDGGGNEFTCSFDVTVNGDGNVLILNCPNDINITVAPGECDAIATWVPPTIDENCDAAITSNSHEPGDTFLAGTTTVTYTAMDSEGNELICTFDVNVAYDVTPDLVCPNDITVNVAPGACTASVNWEIPTLSNDCELSTVMGDFEPGDALPIGTTTVTYTAEDFGGNEFECSFNITVIGDSQASPLVCPDDITIGVPSGQCETAVTWEPPIPDPNCGITITGSTHEPGDIFQIGTTTITYTATDDAGNIVECSFDVTVTYAETPELFCPEDIVVDAVLGTCTASVTWSIPIFSSTCGLETLEGDFQPGDVFPVGTTVVTYTGEDIGGNIFTCDFNITVNSNGPPIILDCPDNIEVSAASGDCDASVTWIAPTVDEDCDAIITSSSHQPGDIFPIGVTTVTYTAANTNGDESTCSFEVTVTNSATTTLVCPLDITVNASSGGCTTSVTWTPPTLSNDCELTTLTSDFNPGDNFQAGVSTVTYIGTDASGGTFECSFDITVLNDNETSVFDCPNDITIPLIPGQCQASVTWQPPVPDEACGVTITGSTHEPGDIFPVGTTTVVYTAVDDSGNVFQCDFDITIVYSTTPDLVCPNDIMLNTNAGTCTTTATWTEPILDNGCELSTLVSNFESGDVFPTGTTTVTYTGADTGGNVFECSFDIIVVNNGVPIILDCPADIDLVAQINNGQCDAIATWEPPTADENCDVVSIISSHNPGDSFQIGTTTVSYVVTDGSGNTNTCSFDVTVIYDEVPTLTCPFDITVDADANSCLTAVSWEIPTLTNGCNLATLNSNHDPGDNFPAGTTTVIYTGEDTGGNIFECSFDITVISDGDVEVWDCPGNVSVLPFPGACEAVGLWEPPVPNANCGIEDVSSTHQPGDIFPVGTTTVIYTAIDISGNVFECVFDVIVSDVQPIIDVICQDNIINIFAEEGACDAAVVWNPPIVIDNCATEATLSSTHESGDIFPVGTTTVTYTVTDPGGNIATCSFDITVIDTEVPTIDCPSDITVDNTPGQCFAAVNWAIPNVSDNCGIEDVSSTHQPGDIFLVGVTTVEYLVSDAQGNIIECSFNVTVEDNEVPQVIECPMDIMVSTDPGTCSAVVTWEPPTTVDNCSSIIAGSTHTPGALFPLGTTTVLYGILDGSGNGTTCLFNVTVVDDEAPTMECPANITAISDPGSCGAAVNWNVPIPFDNCGAEITSSSHSPGAFFPIGTTTVSYTATDITGAQVSCSFDITVIDNEPPTVTCPLDIIATNDSGQCGRVVNWSLPSFDDNCEVADISISHQPGDFFPVGNTIVTYTLTDNQGNVSECSFTVTVNDIEIPRVVSCPDNIVVMADPGECNASVSWNNPLVADNCSALIVGNTHTPGALFPIGTTLVVYGILDDAGNGNACFFTVTVLDNEPPIMDCPADITVSNDAGQCGATVNWTEPIPFDNCGAELTSNSHTPGDFFPIGTTTVTYTAAAADGTEISCSFDITVRDTEVPTIACPDNIMSGTDIGVCEATVTWDEPTFGDNCPGASISSTASPGDVFELGTTTVTYTVTDAEGNITECHFDISVEDREPPMVTGCPDDIVVPNDPGACSAIVSWEPPTFTDNCGVLSVESKPSPGSLFPIGTTNVLYEAIDAAGNITSCEFTVTVEDTEDPMLTCPADIVVSNDDGECGASVNWASPIPVDNCGAEITANTHSPGDFFPIGTTTVTYTTVNSEGLELTCSFDITVEDREDPVLNCPGDISVPFDSDCNAVVAWDIGVLDNCGAEIISNTHNSGDIFPFGTTTVTYIAEDANGNTNICLFDVTVTDNESPTILNCPEDLTVAGPPGQCEGPVIIPTPQFGIDFIDCQENTTIVNNYNGTANASDIYPVGTTVITWTVTDPAGNSVTCQQTIIVTPTDFMDDVAFFTDKDVFVGAGFDNADFADSDSILIFDPGVPPNTVVNTVILDFFFRPEGNSCERDVEVEVTDPAGTVFSVFAAPTGTCNGNDAGFQFLLPVASVPTEASGGGIWKLRFRDVEDQNPVSDGPINVSTPAGTEFSVRFGRITYDITITPDCEGGSIVDEDDTPSALPVELEYFKGTEEDCEAILSWGTASEINVSHFDIQRSYDGLVFSTIERMDALGGEGIAIDYSYTDAQLTLTNYYRLRIVDFDGQVEYSDIFTIQADCAGGVSISDVFPNPTVNQLINIQFNSNFDHEDAKVVVRDMLGRTMMEVPITVFLGSNLITVDPTRLTAAQYVLVIEGSNWRSTATRFIKLD